MSLTHLIGKEKNIIITAYSPLGNNITGKPRVIDAPAVIEIAKKVNKTPAQVLIAWGAHQGFVVIPKSVTPERIEVSPSAPLLGVWTDADINFRSRTLMISSSRKRISKLSMSGVGRTGSGRMLLGNTTLSMLFLLRRQSGQSAC